MIDRLSDEIVMFSPLPPQMNGIADYTFEILGALGTAYTTTVVVDDGCFSARAPENVRILSLAEYELKEESFAGILHIYQIGNNPDHAFMLPVMARRPGLVVLHDPSLHHLLDLVSASTGDGAAYSQALQREYGEAGRTLGAQFEKFRLREQRMYFDLPMLNVFLAPALGVIVHSRFAAIKVLTRVADARVTIVPHQYSPPSPEQVGSRAETRARLGIQPNEVLFVSLGFVTKAKLVDEALRALASVRGAIPPFRYLIAGELRPDEVDVPALVSGLGLEDYVITPGYVGEEEFFSLIQASDVVINLRYPVGGETSGSMIRALGGGACIIVVNKGPFAELPDEAACKLDWAPGFGDRLAALLLKLAKEPDMRARIGEEAQQLILRNNSLQATVDGYISAIGQAQARHARQWYSTAIWSDLPPHELSRFTALATDRGGGSRLPLWFSAGVVPVCAEPARTICWGATETEAELLRQLGHTPELQTVDSLLETRPEHDSSRNFDLAIVFIKEDFLSDCSSILAGLNLHLAFQGLLVFCIQTGTGKKRHALNQRSEGTQMLQRFGFVVQRSFVAAPPTLMAPPIQVAETIGERCWRATKVTEFIAGKTDLSLVSQSATV